VAVAIFLGGSHVWGEAGPDSDVDFDVLVPDAPRNEWPAWYDVLGDRLVRSLVSPPHALLPADQRLHDLAARIVADQIHVPTRPRRRSPTPATA